MTVTYQHQLLWEQLLKGAISEGNASFITCQGGEGRVDGEWDEVKGMHLDEQKVVLKAS